MKKLSKSLLSMLMLAFCLTSCIGTSDHPTDELEPNMSPNDSDVLENLPEEAFDTIDSTVTE